MKWFVKYLISIWWRKFCLVDVIDAEDETEWSSSSIFEVRKFCLMKEMKGPNFLMMLLLIEVLWSKYGSDVWLVSWVEWVKMLISWMVVVVVMNVGRNIYFMKKWF